MVKRLILFSTLLLTQLLLFSCRNKDASREKLATDSTTFIRTTIDSAKQSQVKTLPDAREIAEPLSANNDSTQILTTGTFHSDEVSPGVEQLAWYGLFSGPNSYTLRKSQIVTSRVVDPILDDEAKGEKTGWEVRTSDGEEPVVLISGVVFPEGPGFAH